jgi:exosortase family protein XrtG
MMPAVLFIIWILLLHVFKKIDLHFFKFFIGSIGLFCFLMYIGINSIETYLEYTVTWCAAKVGEALTLFTAYPDCSLVIIPCGANSLSFYVDYECSGFVEMLVYLCLLCFFPVYRVYEKANYLCYGVLYIFFANILRVLVICLLVKKFGEGLFFYSNTIIARVLFFICMVGLYYFTFTRSHILRQKVGNLSYADK